jgi:uncharacterized hydrophobic protein (TIGR00271 family)
MNQLANLIRENRFTPEDVPRFEAKLFFEGARRRPYLERFGVLLFLATIIATAGIISDSTATVIGAMIIAPLMLPIMATATALVVGQMERAIHSSLLVAAGVAGVIALAWLIGVLYPDVILFSENSQILARTSPRVLDLIAALASGAAGAFCMSRDDIADSLPGVAIAISLVPPLCVVGLSLAYGEWRDALGALLLFITNMLAILLAGGGVLAILGLTQSATVQLKGNARRNAFGLIVFSVLLVAIPLWMTGVRINQQTKTEILTRQTTEQWLSGTEFEVRQVQIIGNQASIVITGPGTMPPFEQLVEQIKADSGTQMIVEVEKLPAEKYFSEGTAASIQ